MRRLVGLAERSVLPSNRPATPLFSAACWDLGFQTWVGACFLHAAAACTCNLPCSARGGGGQDEDLREPLVRRQGSQVSMRVARGSASWLSSHGRGLGPRPVRLG